MSEAEGQGRPRSRGRLGNRDIMKAVSAAVLKAGRYRVSDLSADLGVSEVTVRKCLDDLEHQGVVQRFHGEARAYSGDDIPFRMNARYAEKRAIADMAAELVEPGDTVFLEAGSAVALFAERIKGLRGLSVITANLFIARLFRGSRTKVIVLSGLYQEECESIVGPAACAGVGAVGFSKSFFGISGFTQGGGFMLNDVSRAEVTREVLMRGAACGAKAWALTDSSKFGVSHAAPVCSDLSLVSGVVTDSGLPGEYRTFLEGLGLRVLVAELGGGS
jgi:DeoR/GlpR family transcriptional regulator of sugar metabolism